MNVGTIPGTADIQFNISWDNSWKFGTLYYDAAWVFAKYSVYSAGSWGAWQHASINHVDYPTGASGTALTINLASDYKGAFIYRANPDPGSTLSTTGVRLRWAAQSDLNTYTGTPTLASAQIKIQVFAIEMVHIPQGAFYVGDGATTNIEGQLTAGTASTGPYQITSEAALTLGGSSGNIGNNNTTGMTTGYLDDFNTATATPPTLPDNTSGTGFPKGYQAFYCMKYKITQGQYRDFLNKLTRAQQVNRVASTISVGTTAVTNTYVMSGTPPNVSTTATDSLTIGTGSKTLTTVPAGLSIIAGQSVSLTNGSNIMSGSVTSYSGTTLVVSIGVTSGSGTYSSWTVTTGSYRNSIACASTIDANLPVTFFCDLNSNGIGNEANDGEWIACNYLNWMDLCAYAAWAALRPMTELEYEKAARGPKNALANEYAWGSTNIYGATGISNPGTISELGTNTNNNANCAYNGYANAYGPLRTGFASTSTTTTRESAGASFYGIMELSGNLWERAVGIGMSGGRSFTGTNGVGSLSTAGWATNSDWPGYSGGIVNGNTGGGCRGGLWNGDWAGARVSDRFNAAVPGPSRGNNYGGRLVRTSP